MNNVKHSLVLNLSSQANTVKCQKSNLSQFNFAVILGLEYLNKAESLNKTDDTPISISIDKEGHLSINGFDSEMIDENNICIYTDKKVTKSDQ